MSKKKKKDNYKDKFDKNIERDETGTVDNDNVNEETGYNKGKKRDKPSTGEGLEEFIDDGS